MFSSRDVSLDWLSIRLNIGDIDNRFFSCVPNSPTRDLTDGIFISCKLEFENDYSTHKIYYITDDKNNKLIQVMIVNPLLNKKSDFFDKITFYGTYFNLYHSYYPESIFNFFKFFGITNNNRVTRFDVQTLVRFVPKFKEEYFQKIKSQGSTWHSYKKDKLFKFRIYDKLLDIVDNLLKIQDNYGNFYYRDLYEFENKEKDGVLRRIEREFNSSAIKEKQIVLSQLFDNIFLFNLLQNKCFQFLDNSGFEKKIYIKTKNKEDCTPSQIRYDNIKKHTISMFRAYSEKLLYLDFFQLQKEIMKIPGISRDLGFNDIVSAKSRITGLKTHLAESNDILLRAIHILKEYNIYNNNKDYILLGEKDLTY